jgi:putative NADH-flavin reductase
MSAMKLLVLGGTGGTGRHIVQQALGAGHEVTVFARDPTKVGTHHAQLRVVNGDVTALAALTQAIQGQDAVISAIGRGLSFKSENLMERSVPVILNAMETAGVSRLVFTSAWGVGDPFRNLALVPWLFFRTLLRGIYADKLVGDTMIRNSNLDWTLVLPARLHDGPLTRQYHSGERLRMAGMQSISRADTAHFILACVTDASTIRKAPIVTD